MPVTLVESLRWRDPPARAAVEVDGKSPRVHLQMTMPRDVAALCVGRPAEELPRILSILSPAHHLCGAQLLDKLFGVQPPPAAANAREVLRLALVFRHHLRKVHFLGSSVEPPFVPFRSEGVRRGAHSLRPFLDDVIQHVSAAQEAAAIIGARADHPVTAVAGGITRTLKKEHHARLAEIALACRGCAERVAAFVRERVVAQGELLGELGALKAGPLASLALASSGELVLRDRAGAEAGRFQPSAFLDHVAFQEARWTHEPFAFLKAKGWAGLDPAKAEGLFFVGPLARLNGGEALPAPLAEAERARLVAALGPFPRFEVSAAWWALAIEALAAAEGLVALCDPEKLTGPALRTIPGAPAAAGQAQASLEAPEGLVWQHVKVGERGVVEEVRVLDTAAANNALLGIVAQRAAEASVAQGRGWDEIKKRMELALLAY